MSPSQKRKKAAPIKAKSAKASSKPRRKASPAPLSDGRVNVLVWLKARKGKEIPLARALRALAKSSRAEPGCLVFDLHHSMDRPADFFVHEMWSSEGGLASHRQTPHFKHWSGLQAAILESRRRYLAE